MKRFKAPKRSLGDLEAESAATLITAASDLSLVIDSKGLIRDVAVGSDELSQALEEAGEWTGRAWVSTVTPETRAKVEALLGEVAGETIPRWRQVNHPVPGGADIPVLYSAVQISRGRTVAVGRDLRPVAALQQRLVEAQQSIERDYWRLHHAETRYRLLFQMASEAILVVDAASEKVVEANPAADVLLGDVARRLMGRSFTEIFDGKSTQAVQALLAGVRATGRADEVNVRLGGGKRAFKLSASLFRQEASSLYLVRLAPQDAEEAAAAPSNVQSQMLRLLESAPDAFVVTGTDGQILAANRAFLDLAQLASEEQTRDESLERWLGRPGVDLNVLVANLRQHGSVRLFATTLRGEYGTSTEVEISAVAVNNSDQPCFGFTIRNVGRRLASDASARRELPRSVEQLTELVGRVSLKDLVREATDVIERLCIEAALELTGDNRASAAEMLGLSRQSLYVKLRRYGLGDLATEPES